jgi:Domain of unknown function (DUF4136)
MKHMRPRPDKSVAVAVCTGGRTQKFTVTITTVKDVDFTALKTYSWTPGRPAPDRDVNSRVVAAVDRELGVVDMTRVTRGAGDVLATYYARPNRRRQRTAAGTLVVALLDAHSRQKLLQLRTDVPSHRGRSRIGAAFDSAVAALFAEYPTFQRTSPHAAAPPIAAADPAAPGTPRTAVVEVTGAAGEPSRRSRERDHQP